ncbi:Clavaminate synthase-like protein [Corynespora cassiicola Philippines]|uniref:Clavaminate synthase-like protein n=1 Tax=Corynespora cassiicola Philippines TaxID=1448308 RepID=A0A2T2N4E7_CORCC|nr:Clavaminate synthase-like protein [Corynespora cassiicola Philippines]
MTGAQADSPIPVIDFSLFLNGTEVQRREVAEHIDNAFQNVGFVYLKNHGVEERLVEKCFEWVWVGSRSKKFFDLPLETKILAPHPPGGSHHRGYSAPGLEKVSQHAYDEREIAKLREVPDYKESFESGNVDDKSQPNIWPPEDKIPGFRSFLEGLFPHLASLIHNLLSALSLSLSLPSPGLPPTHSQSLFQLRLLHYPSLPASSLLSQNRSRINAHSDFGTLTLLFQDAVGGLQIEDPKQPGVFRDVGALDGAVLVNVGDLMERWSNGRWRSTVHRVGVPPSEVVAPDRYSIPFFATADPDTLIEALPGCWDEKENPKKYEPVTAWGYVQMRMKAIYEG